MVQADRAEVPQDVVAAAEQDAVVQAGRPVGVAGGPSAGRRQASPARVGTVDAEATHAGTARELVELTIDTDCLDDAGRVEGF